MGVSFFVFISLFLTSTAQAEQFTLDNYLSYESDASFQLLHRTPFLRGKCADLRAELLSSDNTSVSESDFSNCIASESGVADTSDHWKAEQAVRSILGKVTSQDLGVNLSCDKSLSPQQCADSIDALTTAYTGANANAAKNPLRLMRGSDGKNGAPILLVADANSAGPKVSNTIALVSSDDPATYFDKIQQGQMDQSQIQAQLKDWNASAKLAVDCDPSMAVQDCRQALDNFSKNQPAAQDDPSLLGLKSVVFCQDNCADLKTKYAHDSVALVSPGMSKSDIASAMHEKAQVLLNDHADAEKALADSLPAGVYLYKFGGTSGGVPVAKNMVDRLKNKLAKNEPLMACEMLIAVDAQNKIRYLELRTNQPGNGQSWLSDRDSLANNLPYFEQVNDKSYLVVTPKNEQGDADLLQQLSDAQKKDPQGSYYYDNSHTKHFLTYNLAGAKMTDSNFSGMYVTGIDAAIKLQDKEPSEITTNLTLSPAADGKPRVYGCSNLRLMKSYGPQIDFSEDRQGAAAVCKETFGDTVTDSLKSVKDSVSDALSSVYVFSEHHQN